jgi:hypothetical protein
MPAQASGAASSSCCAQRCTISSAACSWASSTLSVRRHGNDTCASETPSSDAEHAPVVVAIAHAVEGRGKGAAAALDAHGLGAASPDGACSADTATRAWTDVEVRLGAGDAQQGEQGDRQLHGSGHYSPSPTPELVEPAGYRFDICGELRRPLRANDVGIVEKVIPGDRCAVARHIGSMDAIGDTVRTPHATWLLQGGGQLRDSPFFFHCVQRVPSVAEHEQVTDMYLPLRREARAGFVCSDVPIAPLMGRMLSSARRTMQAEAPSDAGLRGG